MGFEPTISTVTGWRALRTAPRGPASAGVCLRQGLECALVLSAAAGTKRLWSSSSGGSRTPALDYRGPRLLPPSSVGVRAWLVLSQGGLPIAYRAIFPVMPKAGVEPAIARAVQVQNRAEPRHRLDRFLSPTEHKLPAYDRQTEPSLVRSMFSRSESICVSVSGLDDPSHMSSTESTASGSSTVRPAFHQRKSFRTAVVLALYIGSYSILTANGEYRWRPSGEHRYGFGMAMFDLSLWCPAAMRWERRKSVSGEYIIEADPFGWFYLPLIAADRRWVHPTTNVFDPEGE